MSYHYHLFDTFKINFIIRFSRYGFQAFRLNGDGEIRTLDPLLARQVLSQLSYAPMFNLAATYSPTSSPMQYHRPLKS